VFSKACAIRASWRVIASKLLTRRSDSLRAEQF
jgi:hypothetical protein